MSEQCVCENCRLGRDGPARIAELEAQCAAMREALEESVLVLEELLSLRFVPSKPSWLRALGMEKAALATDAGREYIARMAAMREALREYLAIRYAKSVGPDSSYFPERFAYLDRAAEAALATDAGKVVQERLQLGEVALTELNHARVSRDEALKRAELAERERDDYEAHYDAESAEAQMQTRAKAYEECAKVALIQTNHELQLLLREKDAQLAEKDAAFQNSYSKTRALAQELALRLEQTRAQAYEECAKVAEDEFEGDGSVEYDGRTTGRMIATAIRAKAKEGT